MGRTQQMRQGRVDIGRELELIVLADLRQRGVGAEVALLAGMRAAVDAVLTRFDPQVLKRRLAPKAKWQQLLPAARKAELWESYEQGYAQIVEEIEGDFDSLFNRAFLKAYQEQLAQLAPGAASAGRKVGNHD